MKIFALFLCLFLAACATEMVVIEKDNEEEFTLLEDLNNNNLKDYKRLLKKIF